MTKLIGHSLFCAVLAFSNMAAPATAKGDSLFLSICGADGVYRTVEVPLPKDGEPSRKECPKPCHAVCDRKKSKL